MDSAFQYMIDNRGVNSHDRYPYKERQLACKYDKDASVGSPRKIVRVAQSEEALKNAVIKCGPISVAVDASSRVFQLYGAGILVDNNCKENVNHAVTVVGFGADNGKEYWIVKNSWGASVRLLSWRIS